MAVKIISEADAPNQVHKKSMCADMEEWKDVLVKLETLSPGRVIEVQLGKSSQALIGGSNKHAYFSQCLRVYFKNNKIPAVAYSKNDLCYVKRKNHAA